MSNVFGSIFGCAGDRPELLRFWSDMDRGSIDTEIARLLESFSAPIVAVDGPAGSGKTRLLARFSSVFLFGIVIVS